MKKTLEVATGLFLAVVTSCNNPSDQLPAAVGRMPLAGDIAINEFLADPDSDANGDGTTSGFQDEFVELVNASVDTLNLSGVTISAGDATITVRHVFAATASLLPFQAVVVFGGGTPTCTVPAGVSVQVASSGGLGLINLGATITVRNDSSAIIDQTTYSSSKNDVSKNRSPDITGNFNDHDVLPGSIGNYSPGTKANGSAFQ